VDNIVEDENLAEYYVAFLNRYVYRGLAISLGLILLSIGFKLENIYVWAGFRPPFSVVFGISFGVGLYLTGLIFINRNAKKLDGYAEAKISFDTNPGEKARMSAYYKASKFPFFTLLTGNESTVTVVMGFVAAIVTVWLW